MLFSFVVYKLLCCILVRINNLKPTTPSLITIEINYLKLVERCQIVMLKKIKDILIPIPILLCTAGSMANYNVIYKFIYDKSLLIVL